MTVSWNLRDFPRLLKLDEVLWTKQVLHGKDEVLWKRQILHGKDEVLDVFRELLDAFSEVLE